MSTRGPVQPLPGVCYLQPQHQAPLGHPTAAPLPDRVQGHPGLAPACAGVDLGCGCRSRSEPAVQGHKQAYARHVWMQGACEHKACVNGSAHGNPGGRKETRATGAGLGGDWQGEGCSELNARWALLASPHKGHSREDKLHS